MLQLAQMNSRPELCCATGSGTVSDSAEAADSLLERAVDRLRNTIFGYRYLLLKSRYKRERESER